MSIIVSSDQVSPIHKGPHPLSSITTTSTISMTTTHHDDPLRHDDLCHPAVLPRPVTELIWLQWTPVRQRPPPSSPPLLSFPVIPPPQGVKATKSEEASHSDDETHSSLIIPVGEATLRLPAQESILSTVLLNKDLTTTCKCGLFFLEPGENSTRDSSGLKAARKFLEWLR